MEKVLNANNVTTNVLHAKTVVPVHCVLITEILNRNVSVSMVILKTLTKSV